MGNEFKSIEKLFASFLGSSKGGFTDTSQIQYCCPACAADDGVVSDGKYNLEINVFKGVFRCWKCQYTNNMSGRISKLFKKYGGSDGYGEYSNLINEIRESKLYLFEDDVFGNSITDGVIELPKNTYDFKFDGNGHEKIPLNNLTHRGLTHEMIQYFGLKYTTYDCPYEDRVYNYRIILPSYDIFDELNYYTGRSYESQPFFKYFNVRDVKKEDIIFNEKFINWDGDIVLVEGPYDHMVIPNSIPMLGKELNANFKLFHDIIKKSTGRIIIFLDADAGRDTMKILKSLSRVETCDRLEYVPTKKLMDRINNENGLSLTELDPSNLFQMFGKRGIAMAMRSAIKHIC